MNNKLNDLNYNMSKMELLKDDRIIKISLLSDSSLNAYVRTSPEVFLAFRLDLSILFLSGRSI